MAGKAMMLLLGVVIGYGARDVMLSSRTRIWTDIRVIERHGPQYLVDIGHSEYSLVFCPDNVPDFSPGYVLKRLVAERQGNCLSVSPRGTQYIIARQ